MRPSQCVLLLLAAAAIAPAQTFTTLVNFDDNNGARPVFGSLVQGVDGNLYGTTHGGNSAGTIFNVSTGGTLTTLYKFDREHGDFPTSGLVLATDGKFYGTTPGGGGIYHNGSIYSMTPGGAVSFLFAFRVENGIEPEAPLIQATDGTLYGTARLGGAYGYGTVFTIDAAGALTTLYSFTGSDDGADPVGALVQAIDGDLYGTTTARGAAVGEDGTVFKITLQGGLTTLFSFNGTNGGQPYAALIQAADGDFYGTTLSGGVSGYGTVFEMTPSGTLTTLLSFLNDGAFPSSPLVQATDGNFYGATERGGDIGFGSVFKIDASGTLTTLHSFEGSDGEYPYGGLVQATDGNFYGTTSAGGTGGHGTIFGLNTGLGPFVRTIPTSGKVGSSVMILGTNFSGPATVTFNGKPAAITAQTNTEITAIVPAGATTGKVQVTTPGGTLSSNVVFRVTQ